ncbi:MAG TPA: glycosyltransferase [Chloroflexia bacterium]|nr:glycosyltransferase [Chloroflexia bacterium]
MPSANPLRVGYVVKRYPVFSETFIVSEILAHEAAGLDVEIFALYPPNDTHFQDIIAQVRAPVHYIPREGIKAADLWTVFEQAGAACPGFWDRLGAAHAADVRDLYQAASLAAMARARGITHLHAHFASVATTVARLAGQLSGLPYTFTAHAKDIFHEDVDPAALRRKLADAAATVTVSDYNLTFLREQFGRDAARVQRIYNGLGLSGFPYRDPGDRPRHIVAVGRLVEKKGFADLVNACAVLAAGGVDFTCEIIGAGALEADLQARIAQHALGGRVVLSGPRPQQEVVAAVQRAAVVPAPCVRGTDGNQDGLPTVLLEAMALGTPVVGTPVTGIPEVVRDGVTGLLVPEHDPPALAAALRRLLDDAALRTQLAGRARRLVETEFDSATNSARLRALFAAIAGRPAHQEAA